MTRYWIGTSGYSYKQWKGKFYPEKLPDREMLRYYSEHLDSVEINYTFYRFATVKLLEGWAGKVGDGFRFALKAPRRVTHTMRLRDAGEIAGDFCRNAKTLGEKLGPILFQLPPHLKRDVARLEEFLQQVPRDVRVVFEFRNGSWFEDDVMDCLRRFGVALCMTDGGKPEIPGIESGTGGSLATADFGYLRLREAAYDDSQLAEMAERIRFIGSAWSEAFVYFKHEEHGPSYVTRLRSLLDSVG